MQKLKEKYTIEYVRNNNLLLFETVVGSHAFGLNTETSDIDLYGVFFMELSDILSMQVLDENYNLTIEQKSPDITYIEISKFADLLNRNDANALEILQSVLNKKYTYLNEKFITLDINEILSKKCLYSFGNYAKSQIQKAKAKNKKIVNPVDKERKDVIDFCYYLSDNGKTLPLKTFLKKSYRKQLYCGVTKAPHAKDIYALFYDNISDSIFNEDYDKLERDEIKAMRKLNKLSMGFGFKGIALENNETESNEIRLSSIPHDDQFDDGEIEFLGYFSYNKDGYIQYCKDYREYWEFVEKRNPVRYSKAEVVGYDQKNLSHCVRLLNVAKEIAQGNGIQLIRTTDRQHLMDIKFGLVPYNDLVDESNQIYISLPSEYSKSKILDIPNYEYINNWLVRQRNIFYQ
jgi:hypothetical protein